MKASNLFPQVLMTFVLVFSSFVSSLPSNLSLPISKARIHPPPLLSGVDLQNSHVITSCVNPADFNTDVQFVSANLGLLENSPFCLSVYDSLNCPGDSSVVFTSNYSYGFAIDDVVMKRSFGPCQIRNESNCPLNSTKPVSKRLEIEESFRNLGPHKTKHIIIVRTITLQPGNCSNVPTFPSSSEFLSYYPPQFQHDSFCVKAFFSDNCEGHHIQLNPKDFAIIDYFPYSVKSFSTCDFNCPEYEEGSVMNFFIVLGLIVASVLLAYVIYRCRDFFQRMQTQRTCS